MYDGNQSRPSMWNIDLERFFPMAEKLLRGFLFKTIRTPQHSQGDCHQAGKALNTGVFKRHTAHVYTDLFYFLLIVCCPYN